MDPYLESPAFWRDFHASFVTYWRDALADLLPEHYEARIDERIILDEPESFERPRGIHPDIALLRKEGQHVAPRATTGVATLEPVTLTLPVDQIDESVQRFIEVFKQPDRELVAVLEPLSPSNKQGADRPNYLAKRQRLTRQEVHLVEVDLLRGGPRLPMKEALPSGDYYAFISRADRRPKSEVYAWSIRQPLPVLPIPLKSPDPDVRIDMQAVFSTTYDRGRCSRALRYDEPLAVPPRPDDRQWVADLARTMVRS